MNYRRLLHLLATLLTLLAAALVVPAAAAVFFSEPEALRAFASVAVFAAAFGIVGRRLTTRAPRALHRRDALVVVVSAWVLTAVVTSLPWVLSGALPAFREAFFESMSAITTTGATVIRSFHELPRSVLLWRSLCTWMGGMGIVLLFVAILPALGVSGRFLRQAEASGLGKDDVRPRVRDAASVLLRVYAGLTLAIFLALLPTGIGVFDSLTHAFSTVATSGFSSREGSVAEFGSPAVSIVLTVGMLLAGMNFALVARVRREPFAAVAKDPELRAYLAIIAIAATVIVVGLLRAREGGSVLSAVGHGIFHATSLGTSTGFSSTEWASWPDSLRFVIVVLMLVGGCEGSSAGGLKVSRVVLVFRVLGHELRRFIRPHRVSSVMVGGHPVSEDGLRSVLAFLVVFAVVATAGTGVLALLGVDIVTSAAASLAMLGNVGPALGAFTSTSNYAEFPGLAKDVLALLMLLGRLEIFAVIAVFMPSLYEE